MREIVIGSAAFWCPETPNHVVGVSAEIVVVSGHARTFVWAMPRGELLAVWGRRDLQRAIAVAREGDEIVIDERHRRLRLEGATGATRAEEVPVAAARLDIDDARTGLTLTAPGGAQTRRTIPWTRAGCVARDGRRYALDAAGGVTVHDARTHEVVHVAARGGTPTLSADGRYLVVSLLGPPRTWIEDVDRRAVVTPPAPPAIHAVTLGHPSLAVVDDGVWTLPDAPTDAPALVASIPAAGATRAIRGETLVGCAGGRVGRWRLRDGAALAAVELPAGGVWSASVDAAGRRVALTLDDSGGLLAHFPDGVWLADLDAGTLARITADAGPATVAIAPAGDVVAIVDEVGETVRVVDEAGALRLAPALPAPVRWAAFAPDGERLLVVGDAGGVETAYVVGRRGAVAPVGAGTWRGWSGDALVRRAGGALERVDPASGRVLAVAAAEPPPARVWLDDRRVAIAGNDGCLRLRALAWRTMPA